MKADFAARDRAAWGAALSHPGALKFGSHSVRIPCPAHGGTSPNAALDWRGGKLLACCHSRGCPSLDVLNALAGPDSSGWTATPPVPSSPEPRKADDSEKRRIDFARRIWRAAVCATGTPAHDMLAARGAWPPGRPLPDSVRWLEAGPKCPVRLPAGADGAAVYRFADCEGELTGVQVEPVRARDLAASERVPFPDGGPKRKSFGVIKGATFRAGEGDRLVFVEGPADTLAMAWRFGLAVRAVGGTAGLKSLPRNAVVSADFDRAGLDALPTDCRVQPLPHQGRGMDPADAVRAALDAGDRDALKVWAGPWPLTLADA